jgi:hypothetical protein
MTHRLRWLVCGITVSLCLLLLGRGEAGGDKDGWQPILSKDVYQQLVTGEVDFIRGLLKDKPTGMAMDRAKFGAVLIAAMTMCTKDGVSPDDLKATRGTALELATTLNDKNKLDAARKLAAELPRGKAGSKDNAINWASYLKGPDLMDHYRTKDKGGDGMHLDLQSNTRLKGALNGIEEKILAMTKKAMPAAALDKEARELEVLGYRSAVVGALIYHYAPPKTAKQDPQVWRKLSVEMRNNAVSLATAASKRDADGVLKASSNLSSSCNQCHTDFR